MSGSIELVQRLQPGLPTSACRAGVAIIHDESMRPPRGRKVVRRRDPGEGADLSKTWPNAGSSISRSWLRVAKRSGYLLGVGAIASAVVTASGPVAPELIKEIARCINATEAASKHNKHI
jgi:hypothetical protein